MTRFGLVGFGFVGQALYGSVKNVSDWVIYDKFLPDKSDNFNMLGKCDYIFTCLPTLDDGDGNQDFSAYAEFFSKLKLLNYHGIIVIKSTVLYKNIAPYIKGKDNPEGFNIVFNPEFLNQNNSYDDFKNQSLIILGGNVDLLRKVKNVYNLEFNFPDRSAIKYEYCSIKEAIQLKYTHNVYHAYKVLYWHYIQEITGNERKLFDLYSKVTGNTNEMARICADGKPGYGGACFPKDVNAFNEEHPHILTDFMKKYNFDLRKGEA